MNLEYLNPNSMRDELKDLIDYSKIKVLIDDLNKVKLSKLNEII